MGDFFAVQTHHFKQAGVREIEIETFRFGGVPHGKVWPLDVVQQGMLRSIVGWVCTHNEQWQDTMQRMNGRFEFAMALRLVRKWSDFFFQSRHLKFAIHVAQRMPAWPAGTVLWHPRPDWGKNIDTKLDRKGGRPAQRWDDYLTQFAGQHFGRNPVF